MQDVRNFRPRLHFSPKYGWLNDPNGLIFHNGIWHMYFQHNPGGLVWGPMYWGHAISRDLIHWEEKDIALKPYDTTLCFSGSMVCDRENTSGLALPDEDPSSLMIAFYTGHNMRGHIETQCAAVSHDGGMTFEFYGNNPVIDVPADDNGVPLSDFRDPKVFLNKDNGLWTMVVAAKFKCNFYTSRDLLHWEKTGEFSHHFKEVTNVWACTDLIPFDTPDGRKWVLLASMENGENKPEARTMYFVGDFDGKCFTPEEIGEEGPVWLDFGWDCYAGVSFNDSEERLMTAWGVNPRYANQVPTDVSDFRGIMTLARKMELVKTGYGYRLRLTPAVAEEEFEQFKNDSSQAIPETCMIKVHGSRGSFALKNADGREFVITVTGDSITIDRSNAGLNEFHPDFAADEFSRRTVKRLSPVGADVDMTVIYDVCSIEIYADGGLETASVCVYPEKPYTAAEVTGGLSI